MNIEALTVIGIFTFVLGIILLIPGLWWARRKVRKLPVHAAGRMRVTPFGYIYSAIFVGFLMVVFSLGYLAPELSRGKKFAAFAIVVIVGLLGEKVANKLGFKLVSKNNDSNA